MNSQTQTTATTVGQREDMEAAATYIAACAVAVFGWTIALSRAAFSFLRLVVSPFT
jgi:hypothetical protein